MCGPEHREYNLGFYTEYSEINCLYMLRPAPGFNYHLAKERARDRETERERDREKEGEREREKHKLKHRQGQE